MDVKKINEIIDIFKQANVDELSLELKDFKITLKNNQPSKVVQYVEESIPQVSTQKEEVKGDWVKAPFVGTFYAASNQDSAPYIQVGQKVKKGDVLFILEAMKVMNEIKATQDGTILEIKVHDRDMVEFDQALILIGA